MAIAALVQGASAVGGLFQAGTQDAYKSDPRSKGLTLLVRSDPVVWQNTKSNPVVISDGVTMYEVPPGGKIYQSAGGNPDSGRLTAGEGGTKVIQSAVNTSNTSGTPAASTGNAGAAGKQPESPSLGLPVSINNGTTIMLVVIGGLMLFLLTQGKK